jgi:hypothetical protein
MYFKRAKYCLEIGDSNIRTSIDIIDLGQQAHSVYLLNPYFL